MHITDTHVTASSHTDALRDLLRSAESEADPPAFIVNTGDVTELGTPDEFAAYRSLVTKSSLPVHAVPGNHDVRWAPLGKQAFVQACGPLYRSFDYGGCHFVCLDSTVVMEHWGHFDRAQLDWLARDLRRLRDGTPIVLFFHHWLGRDSTNIDNAGALLKLIEPYNVVAMFVGHGHSELLWQANGITCVMARGLYQGSYHIGAVADGVLTISRMRQAGGVWSRDAIATIPLSPRPRLSISLRLSAENDTAGLRRFDVVVHGADGKPAQPSRVDYALDGGKHVPVTSDDTGLVRGTLNATLLANGLHALEVRATMADSSTWLASESLRVDNGNGPSQAWRFETKDTIQSSPAAADGLVYATSFDGRVYALDAASGRKSWSYQTKGPLFAGPCVAETTVIAVSTDHRVYALDAKTGKLRWQYDTGYPIFSTPAVTDGVVCIPAYKAIHGVDQSTGKMRWRVPAGSFFQARPAADGGVFFVGGWDNTFYAICASDGAIRWKVRMGRSNGGRGSISFYYSPAITSPCVGDGKVFVCTNDGCLHALDAVTGTETWLARAPTGRDTFGYSSPAYAAGRVFLGGLGEARRGDCYALDSATGKLVWQCATGADNYDSGPTVVDGNIVIGSVRGTLSWIDCATGALRYQAQLEPGYCFSTAAAVGRTVYMPSMSGSLTALRIP